MHQIAFGAAAGSGELQIIKQGAGVNSLVPVDLGVAPAATETVTVETVADFCRSHEIAELTLLKIDAEGADLGVLVGATEMFARAKVGIAQFEYNWSGCTPEPTFATSSTRRGVAGLLHRKVTPRAVEFYEAWHPGWRRFVNPIT